MIITGASYDGERIIYTLNTDANTNLNAVLAYVSVFVDSDPYLVPNPGY
ncbi:MAG: hypothetical protein ABGY43_11700 [bacterium]